MTGEVPPGSSERRYERWVMRASELITGFYPDDKEEAEETLLLRLEEGMIGRVSPLRYFGSEEMPKDPDKYLGEGESGPSEAAPSMVFALYLAVGGEEWGLHVEPEEESGSFVRVFGVSMDLEDEQVNLTVDLRSLACNNAEDLRVLHERIVRELPKKDLSVEEAATEALDVVEEMRVMLEGVRELSDAFEVREEIHDVHETLENLWVALGSIAASEEDRRLGSEEDSTGSEPEDE